MLLTTPEARWASVLGAALLPRAEDERGSLDFGADLRARLAVAPWWTVGFVRLALWLTWFAPAWSLGRAATFGSLSPPEQEDLLERLLLHRLYVAREAVAILKLFVCLAVIGEPAALRRLGAYDLARRPAPAEEARP